MRPDSGATFFGRVARRGGTSGSAARESDEAGGGWKAPPADTASPDQRCAAAAWFWRDWPAWGRFWITGRIALRNALTRSPSSLPIMCLRAS